MQSIIRVLAIFGGVGFAGLGGFGSDPLLGQDFTLEAEFEVGAGSEASARAATMPIRLASGKVHVRAELEDGSEVWLLLDSGANVSILDRDLAERLGLELRGGGTADGAAGGGEFRFAFARAPAMRLPGVELASRPVAVLERNTQGANGHPSSGLLGADLFRRFVVDVDYPNRTMTLHEPETFEYSGGGVVLPVRLDANAKWRVQATVAAGGQRFPAELIVDTGARGTVGFSAPFLDKHELRELVGAEVLTTVGVGVGGEVRHYLAILDGLEFGGLELEDLPVTLAPTDARGAYGNPDRDGILGAAILERFRAIFDASRGRLILEPSALADEPIRWDASGLFLTSEGEDFDRIRALAVAPGSPAERAGIELGDRLVAIDGRPVAELGLDGVRSWLRKPESRVIVTLDRAGRKLEVELLTAGSP